MERDKVRKIEEESILYNLEDFIEAAKKKAENSRYKDIKVIESLCIEIEDFDYKINDEKIDGNLFVVRQIEDGESINLIYAKNGRYLGRQCLSKQDNKEIKLAKDIELDRERLEKQIKEEQMPILKNLRNDINLDSRPKYRLDTPIKGESLWNILKLQEKLSERLPKTKGISEYGVKNWYLTFVESSKLQEKDGKERKAKDTFVVCTSNGDVFELDESILKAVPLGASVQQADAEKTRNHRGDGIEDRGPQTETNTTRSSMYQIVDANSNFAVAENWFLAVDEDRAWKENGTTPVDNYNKKLSFARVSRDASYYETVEQPRYTEEYEIDPINENYRPQNDRQVKQESKDLNDLRERKIYDAPTGKNNHYDKMVEECKRENPDITGVYNDQDIKNKVISYHEKHPEWDDKKIIEQIGKDGEREKVPGEKVNKWGH